MIAFRRNVLAPLRRTLESQPFFGGETATYADYIVFGSLQWPRIASRFDMLEPDDVVAKWRERMLDLHDGLARKAVRA
ncbi:MAG: glutathione binding-like protein [Hyphomicrobiaceae bacterium]